MSTCTARIIVGPHEGFVAVEPHAWVRCNGRLVRAEHAPIHLLTVDAHMTKYLQCVSEANKLHEHPNYLYDRMADLEGQLAEMDDVNEKEKNDFVAEIIVPTIVDIFTSAHIDKSMGEVDMCVFVASTLVMFVDLARSESDYKTYYDSVVFFALQLFKRFPAIGKQLSRTYVFDIVLNDA